MLLFIVFTILKPHQTSPLVRNWLHRVAPSCTQHGGYWACVSYWYRYGSARFSERFLEIASVAELVDAADSKSASFTRVWVRVPPLVPL